MGPGATATYLSLLQVNIERRLNKIAELKEELAQQEQMVSELRAELQQLIPAPDPDWIKRVSIPPA